MTAVFDAHSSGSPAFRRPSFLGTRLTYKFAGPCGDRTGRRRSGALAATALDTSHRAQFVFGELVNSVSSSFIRVALARSRSILSLPCAYCVSVMPAAFAISCFDRQFHLARARLPIAADCATANRRAHIGGRPRWFR